MVIIYPTLLHSMYTHCKTKSWYDMKKYINVNSQKRKREEFESTFIDTFKIVLYPNKNQKRILKLWLNDCIDIYNATNIHLKEHLIYKKPNLNWMNIRKDMNNIIKDVCLKNKLNKHTGDYAVKHCVEMWKSSISNHKNINKFNITNLFKKRTRKNLVIEPSSCSKTKNGIFIKILGEMKSNIPIKITKNSVLQYNKNKDTFIIISPKENIKKFIMRREKKCGIDIGCRTFLTTYSKLESFEIGTSKITYPMFNKYYKKLDNINTYNNNTIIKKAREKYNNKLKNKINDMHNKVASILVQKYENIVIGNVSTKKMVSNLKSNLQNITKRRLMFLSHYRFRMKLISLGKKYNCKIHETDEYMTSKTCCNCKNIKSDLTTEKIYNCNKCKLTLDRDFNAAINIFNFI